MNNLETLLESEGPFLSSFATKKFIAMGLSAEAARQRVSRAGGRVRRLHGINFPNREKFFFVEGQYGSPEFKAQLCDALQSTRSAFGRAIAGLTARGGTISASHFPIASGLPVMPAKGQLLHSLIEQKLIELELISRDNLDGTETVTLWNSATSESHRRAVMVVEELLLTSIRSWLIKIGWSSTNALQIRNESTVPQFGQFAWDLTGPCYLAGMVSFEKGEMTPAFIVADLILDRTVSVSDLMPFFSKWEALQAQKRSTRLQPIIIADGFEIEALKILRKKGAFIAMPSVLFGEEIARDLRQLVKSIENAAAAVSNDPTKVFDLLSRMMRLEGAALNLRGVVVEMLIAHLYKLEGYNIDIRQQITSSEQRRAEIDVKAVNRKEVVCCECKGKAPNSLVDAPEIEHWLNVTMPRIKDWISRSTTLPETKRFEFWSATGYTEEAKILIEITEARHKKQPIKFLSGDSVISRLQAQKEKALVDVFREQFLPK